mmetsp:Transcript_43055/g.111513  ORF Transcript_43055/g.111513 Transcript_43055/m.111513 type:complete len:286 (-) Transcript_43055:776-1633(-)
MICKREVTRVEKLSLPFFPHLSLCFGEMDFQFSNRNRHKKRRWFRLGLDTRTTSRRKKRKLENKGETFAAGNKKYVFPSRKQSQGDEKKKDLKNKKSKRESKKANPLSLFWISHQPDVFSELTHCPNKLHHACMRHKCFHRKKGDRRSCWTSKVEQILLLSPLLSIAKKRKSRWAFFSPPMEPMKVFFSFFSFFPFFLSISHCKKKLLICLSSRLFPSLLIHHVVFCLTKWDDIQMREGEKPSSHRSNRRHTCMFPRESKAKEDPIDRNWHHTFVDAFEKKEFIY